MLARQKKHLTESDFFYLTGETAWQGMRLTRWLVMLDRGLPRGSADEGKTMVCARAAGGARRSGTRARGDGPVRRTELRNYAASALWGMVVMAAVVLVGENRLLERLVVGHRPLEVGEKAPRLVAADLAGRRVELGRGPAVVIFFNTTCGACLESAPGWEEFAGRVPGVSVVGVSADGQRDTAAFVRKHALGFPVVADSTHRVVEGCRVSYVPLVVLVDGEGRVRLVQRYGQRTAEALAEVERLVGCGGVR